MKFIENWRFLLIAIISNIDNCCDVFVVPTAWRHDTIEPIPRHSDWVTLEVFYIIRGALWEYRFLRTKNYQNRHKKNNKNHENM